MAELKGTKTEMNLLETFAGESQARNKYSYYASVARKEGFDFWNGDHLSLIFGKPSLTVSMAQWSFLQHIPELPTDK